MSSITADDVLSIIDYFGSVWPWAKWNEKTMAVWIDGLGDEHLHLDGPIAMETARVVAKRWERPESMASFLAEYRNQAERSELGAKGRRELEAGETLKDRRADLLALTRSMLAQSHPHDHRRGLASCGTCIAALRRHITEGCEHAGMHRRDLERIDRTKEETA